MKKVMEKFLIWVFVALLGSTQLFAQQYLWPLKLEPDLASRFGDCRSGHWHAGIDCRTRGQTGFKVYAVQNGYVFKVRVGYWGYGKSMYLKLNDGNIIVYGHLQGFTPEIDRFVFNQQTNQQKYYQEIEFKPSQYPVRKGDVVAISGQSGVGYPHLHMEIRDKDNIPINPQKSFYHLPDNAAPIAVRLAVKRFNEYGVNNYHDLEFIPVVGRNGEYKITDTIAIYGQTVLAVNAYDQGGGFSYGIYRGSLSIDGVEVFAFTRDSLNYLTGSQISYVNDSELQSLMGDQGNSDDDRGTFYRLYCQPYDAQAFYGGYRFPDGLIDAENLDNYTHRILIALYDINGNVSKIRFYAKKATLEKPGFRQFNKYPKETNILMDEIFDDAQFESQILRKYSAGYQNITCRYEKSESILKIPAIGNCKNLRIRAIDKAGDFSPWLIIDPDLKKSIIKQYADFWEFINVRDDVAKPFLMMADNEVSQKNYLSENIWQGMAIRSEDQIIVVKSPGTDQNLTMGVCNSSMSIYSPDSLVSLVIDKKALYGPSVVLISAMENRDDIKQTFQIGTDQLLFNGTAKLNVNTDGLTIDPRTTSLYVKWGSRWYHRAGVINARANCTISGGGEFAFITDDKPPTINGLSPANGASIHNTRPIITCKVSDNLSGLSRESQFGMFIDNRWVPGDYDITTGIFSYKVNQPLKLGHHEIAIKIIDNQGNVASATSKFKVLGKY